ncbi:molybdate transport system substrate-binding protein [Nicoletella semolina]|uniref:Molybdate transport system substrate-binding protein n=1 Tax=Nicoletella semolina TaxID=271160 RepID=A0A4V2SK53_9PAST|nr:molybdate ABC transporter substrate-binding protein [Nicoletella semolina]MDH2924051.1 molybdate ABC transporter substrate-binding protein [Nicoletella semolina]TCP18186.1 molybdate transport system substrate-binding protein [Nicoletella semolina]
MKKIIALLLLIGTHLNAKSLTIFSASSMNNVLQEIGKSYEQAYPEDRLTFSFAASSTLAKQIERDAPADIFISADQKWLNYLQIKQPEKIQQVKFIAKNALVLIAPKEAPLQAQAIQAVNFKKILANHYLAVGDPAHVPVGKYAQMALTYYQRWEMVEPRLARAKNVRDALSFVERREAPLGIVYATDAKISNKVKVIATFPLESHSDIIYPAVILSDKPEAVRFLNFLQSKQAKAIFEQAGFLPVE